ncbi:MAG TPA: CcdC protein domain-containing protein [Devosia sp.]|nr:CcdC protein domain-containing protein [Devosia sp.]
MHGNSQLISYLVTGAVIVLILALRLRRMGQARPLKLEQLWVAPAIFLVICAILFLQSPPDATGWLWCLAALVVGGVIGWYRGKTITIAVDPGTHALNQTASPAGMIFLVALILVRLALRSVLAQEAQALHINAAVVVDAFLGLALGVVVLQRLEMLLRARRLLAAAKAPSPGLLRNPTSPPRER